MAEYLLPPPPLSASYIQHATWLYLCFALSYRDVEELLAERELDIFYETVQPFGAGC
jgi:transposase-like protein